ncbi:MAG: mechanosensitive ion channel family protein [Byssovorax sp.]
MNSDWIAYAKNTIVLYAVPLGGKLLGALVLWIVGRTVIRWVRSMARHNLEKRKLDVTLVRYLDSVLGILLNLLLFLAALSIFGVETASFAGIIGAAGVAIGLAWSGLLSNFAAGVFMVVLRPFKVGDMICAAGVTGVVHEVGLFATTIDTADNIRTFVGNNKIFSDTIQNYTTNPYRRVDLKAQLANGVDTVRAINLIRARIGKIPNVLAEPAPSVELLDFNLAGPVLAVRPFCHNNHYWDVYFATNEAILEELSAAGYPSAEHTVRVRGEMPKALSLSV